LRLSLHLLALVFAFSGTPTARAAEASSRLSFLAADGEIGSEGFDTAAIFSLGARSDLGAGLRLQAELAARGSSGGKGLAFVDRGSFLRFGWSPLGWGETEGLAFTLLPLEASRLHLGYEEPATWGRGVHATFANAPGAELRFGREWWYAFAAARTTQGTNEVTHRAEGLHTWMAGAGADLFSFLWLEAAAATSDLGTMPKPAAQGREVRAGRWGVSGRALHHHGKPVGPSVDFSLLSLAADSFERFSEREVYPGGSSASISLEGSHLVYVLGKSGAVGETATQRSNLISLVARVRLDALRIHGLGLFRSASFPLSEEQLPGFPYPYEALPESADGTSELLVKIGADYHLASVGLTPGLVLGVRRPAVLRLVGDPLGILNHDYSLIRQEHGFSLMESDHEPAPVLSAQATLRWDWGGHVSMLGELSWRRDPNRFGLWGSAVTESSFEQREKNVVGFDLLLQARF
jgi:hypothetical protein